MVLIACAQYTVRDGDPDHNRARSLDVIRRAGKRGADLVVLPELANSGSDLGFRSQALDLAEDLAAGPTISAWKVWWRSLASAS